MAAACGGLLPLVATAALATPAENPSAPIDTIVVQGQKLNVESKIDRNA
jgi:hypothetical protein